MNYRVLNALLIFSVANNAMNFPIDPKNPEFQRRVWLYQNLDTHKNLEFTAYDFYSVTSLSSYAKPHKAQYTIAQGRELLTFAKNKHNITISTSPISNDLIKTATKFLSVPITHPNLVINALAMLYCSNNATAMRKVGTMLAKGTHLQKDTQLAIEFLKKAAETLISANEDLIFAYLDQKQYKEALALLYTHAHNKKHSLEYRNEKLLKHEIIEHMARNNNCPVQKETKKVLEHPGKATYLKALTFFEEKNYHQALNLLRKKECKTLVHANFLEGLILKLHVQSEASQHSTNFILTAAKLGYFPALLLAQIGQSTLDSLDQLEICLISTYGDAFLLNAIKLGITALTTPDKAQKLTKEKIKDYLKKSIAFGSPASFPDMFPYIYVRYLKDNKTLKDQLSCYYLEILHELLPSTISNKFKYIDTLLKKLKILDPLAHLNALLIIERHVHKNKKNIPSHWQNNTFQEQIYTILLENPTALARSLNSLQFPQLKTLIEILDTINPNSDYSWGTLLALRRTIAVELPESTINKILEYIKKNNKDNTGFTEQELPYYLALSLTCETTLKNQLEKILRKHTNLPQNLPSHKDIYEYLIQQFSPLSDLDVQYIKANTLDTKTCFNFSKPCGNSNITSNFAYALLAAWQEPETYNTILGLFYLKYPQFEPEIGTGLTLCSSNYSEVLAFYVDYHSKKDKCKALIAYLQKCLSKENTFYDVFKFAQLASVALCDTKSPELQNLCFEFFAQGFKKVPTEDRDYFTGAYQAFGEFLDRYKKTPVIAQLRKKLDALTAKIDWYQEIKETFNAAIVLQALAAVKRKV